ncbi:g11469 [Coccomyxa viridis]|uniref:G11469 protein n=1 Tax=Coccomyxa viridis TaxID=1274662 RepID=A0ABP1GDP9_9CHLO
MTEQKTPSPFCQVIGPGIVSWNITEAKLARSPDERGIASWEEVKACAVDVPASSIDEKLKQLRASVSCLEGSMGELEAEQGRLRASSRKLHAAAQVKQCETKKLVDELRREARMSKYLSSVVHREEAAASLQALQQYGRAKALACTRISSRVPDGNDRKKIAVRFGSHFMSSLAPGALSAAMPAPGSPADVLRRGMRWADRSFIMEAIDSLESEAVREGARSAYMAFSHCASWEAELRRVEDMLAAPGL